MRDYKKLEEFCITPRQTKVIAALANTPSLRAVSKDFGTSKQAIHQLVQRVERQASRRLYSPSKGLTHPVPENFTGDFTIQRNGEGTIERSWMKGKLDKEQEEIQYKEFIEGLTNEITPAKKVKPPKKYNEQLASAIIFGDAHLGMLAHAVDTLDEDYDLDKGIDDIKRAIDYCVECAVPSAEGWFINVGDFTHANDKTNQTESGHVLDVSARHNQVMRAAGSLIRYCIDKMLTKFKTVRVINARGNHDRDAAFALNMFLEAVYEKEPRVDVLGNDSKFNFLEFGENLIGVNHGDKININRLAGVMTRKQAPAWGRTSFRRWWLGHIHHKITQEHDTGVVLESFNTLAPTDNWHAESGYGANRSVTMVTLHKKYGEVNRMSPSIQMVRDH